MVLRKHIGVAHALFLKNVGIGGIAVHDATVGQYVGQILATLLVGLDNFDFHLVLQGLGDLHSDGTAAHHHELLHIDLRLATHVDHLVEMVVSCSDVYNIVGANHVVASGNDGLAIALNGAHVHEVGNIAHVAQWLVSQFGIGAQFHGRYNELTVEELKPVAHPGMFQGGAYFLGSQVLGIDQVVDTQLLEIVAVSLEQELVVVDTAHRFLGSHVLGHGAGQHVARLIGRDSDKQVALVYTYVLEIFKRDSTAHISHQVVVLETGQAALVGVEDDNVLILVA